MSRRLPAAFAAAAALLLAACSTPPAPTPPKGIGSARRILFIGDSITYDGHYVEYVQEALLLTHATATPVLDVALPSETVSGLSEEGHAGGKFPRPDLHERLDRVLALVKPDLVIASYGENDGIYFPYSEERFAKFKEGILWLRAKVAAAHARLIHLTPSGFDPRPIWAKVAPAGRESYAHPYAGYDEVLARYSQWLVDQRALGWEVIDVHTAIGNALASHRLTDPAFSFAPHDGIHPDPEGHAVIAGAILSAWGYPLAVAKAPLVWAKSPDALTEDIRERNSVLKDAWLTATGHQRPMKAGLPLPEAQAKAAVLTKSIDALAEAHALP